MNLRSRTTAAANTRPISISRSRARRAGNTLTTNSVHAEPSATGMIENGITVAIVARRSRRGASSDADSDEHRRHEDDHHPRCGPDRAREASEKEASRRNRARHQQPKIVGEKERRERGDDAAECEEREKAEEEPRQAEPQQVVTELLVRRELRASPSRRRRTGRPRRATPIDPNTMPRSRSPFSRRRTRLRDAHACGSRRRENDFHEQFKSRRFPAARCRR